MPDVLIPSANPPQESPADKAAREILHRMHVLAIELVTGHRWIFERLWKPEDTTTAEILAALGPRGEELFERGSDLIKFVLGAYNGRPIATMEPSEYAPPYPLSVVGGVVSLVPPSEPEPEPEPNGGGL